MLSISAPRARPCVLAVPACAVVLALAVLFPEGGFEPYPIAVVRGHRGRRAGVSVGSARSPAAAADRARLVYLLACLLCLIIHTPMGSNIERYGVLLAGPLLLCAVAQDRALTRARGSSLAAALALCLAAVWVVWGPVRETLAVAGNESTERLLLRTRRALPGPCAEL